ncbi:methionine/alanine import family NSS transporter small subunit [Planococcus halocryophilus]|nr:methionine/alanine import family NSS transporter small subunit [Planococcus halocryophilus]
MSTSSIVVMIIGMVLVWGGLAASIFHAVNTGRKKRNSNATNNL